MGSGKNSIQSFAAGVSLLIVGLILWELLVVGGAVSSLVMPRPSRVLAAAFHEGITYSFLSNWLRTLAIWGLSLVAGLTIGLASGFAAGTSNRLAHFVLPTFGYLRSIPPIAMFPVAMIAIGPGKFSISVVAILGAALYVFPTTAEASREARLRYGPLARLMGANRLQFLRLFVAPGAAWQALAASRVAATYAFAVCVAGEMIIGGRSGVGAAILDLSERYRLEEAYLYVMCTGLVGLAIDLLFGRISRAAGTVMSVHQRIN